MTHTDPAVAAKTAQAFKVNRITATVMTLATAATLLLHRPDLSLVYLAYTGMSVYPMSWAVAHGLFARPRPARAQNFAAYVSVSTVGFVITLFAAPQMLDLMGSAIFILFAFVVAILVLRAIFDAKWTVQ
ncbi:hypothetical protein PZ897_00275 [Hoeflea sp. YIM 152468]|uniref:hypothetical protein n=1 Tax=Hoeflea sp. YIM 152468 TaxID=3031759 RepID=UPI0023DA3427|nr:hypothetical protein [Hoeflea sp. YIM 152468]MDF1606602.1 hypothetical protein [Hoeflea sp. YIM 152468]